MMKMERRPLCLIPARGGSKRFPRKNVALLAGRPLLDWSISCARASGLFDAVFVSSEDETILALARSSGAVPHKRAEGLGEDHVTLNELCCEVCRDLGSRGYTDLYLVLPTSPLRSSRSMQSAWKIFLESGADTLMSLQPARHPPQWALTVADGFVRPLFPREYHLIRQALPSGYYHDGAHLITRIEKLLSSSVLMGERTVAFFPSPEEGVDINEADDMTWAEFLLARQKEGG